ncbi:TonB-dependent receptor [Capnocytophaga sp. oral taxon 338]|uniref:TonB-dependent receptor n=1 Tax=Capnocytophaga sp. oral taxon 338 TaxID=710239 RepID=UPI0002E1499D|nr:TonB-dependent receptor [Capnocytophaga sp. oral taxon 338]
MKKLYHIFTTLFLFLTFSTYAQDKLGTISVDIVKPYTPTIADVHKPQEETPKKDSVTVAKKKINYTIHSVPVASTFVPEKGKAVRITASQRKDTLYHSYIALGAGSYASFYGDGFVAIPLNEESDLSLDFTHHSSKGKVKGVTLDNNFSNTEAQASYRYGDNDYQLGLSANVANRLMHWYGVEDKTLLPIEASLRQSYLSGGLSGFFSMNKSVFNGIDFWIQGAKDHFQSGETQVKLRPTFKFDINQQQFVTAILDVDYLQGSFDQHFSNSNKIEYRSALIGIKPSYRFSIPNFSIKLGLGAYYAKEKDYENGHDLKIFPDAELSYDAFGDNFILYGGITGNIEQLSYRKQSLENPYLSPTQELHPTFTPYDIFGGVKGALGQGFSYNINLFYKRLENMPLFQANEKLSLIQYAPYQYDNTYKIIYQDAMEYGIKAHLTGKISDQFDMDFSLKANGFSMDKQEEEAWNQPSFTSALAAHYQIIPNWNIAAEFFYVGERKDLKHTLSTQPREQVTLKGFFDLNFSTDYTFLKQWTIFVNLNNVAGENYLRWTNYPVQGFQFLAGVKYSFNIK